MPSIDAVLFDLDDTLLENNMDYFLSRYFPMISEYVQLIIKRERFMKELLFATQEMIQSQDPCKTNREVFWSVFCQRTGLKQEQVEPFVDTFYQQEFPKLRDATRPKSVARNLVRFCFDNNLKVVIATNPLFPLKAIEHRLEWAGIASGDYNYALITAYENMHSTKPNPAYYLGILSEIDVKANRAIMVGDDWVNDIAPAKSVGLFTFWITKDSKSWPERTIEVDGIGSLDDFYNRLSLGWLLA
jgi:HAD superfamily hydrolase (TIGR01549 family)